jgi:drug/metabolite transporter (DMT)-like permease
VLRPDGALWPHWRRYALLGLLGVGCYNSFQYLALHTSSPTNVTLVASSTPVFMLAIGVLFFGQSLRKQQLVGAALSVVGCCWCCAGAIFPLCFRWSWYEAMCLYCWLPPAGQATAGCSA